LRLEAVESANLLVEDPKSWESDAAKPDVGPEALKELNLVSVEVICSGFRPDVPPEIEESEGDADLMPIPALVVPGAALLVPEPIGAL